GAAACSSGSSSTAAAPASSSPMTSSSAMASPSSSAMASGAGASASTMSDFGPGCSAVPKSGAGSFTGMATAPVATAASANPALSTLVTAVKAAGLVATLHSASNSTECGPATAAFAKIPPATLKKLLANKAELTKILTYHVAPARYTPAQLSSGTGIKTLEGGMVTPAAMGSTYEVNKANVGCRHVQHANATVY